MAILEHLGGHNDGGHGLNFSPELWFLEKIGRGEDLNLRPLRPRTRLRDLVLVEITEYGNWIHEISPPLASQCLTCYCMISEYGTVDGDMNLAKVSGVDRLGNRNQESKIHI